MKPEVHAYLSHIADAISAIEAYGGDHTYEQFLESSWDQSALMRYLEIIGEAASQVPQEYKEKNAHIPWRRISDFRNVLIHHYFAVDPALVWEIVKKNIPSLREEIGKLRNAA